MRRPPGELNRAPGPGLNFGFPWYGGGSTRTVEYKDSEPPEGIVFPEIDRNDLFSAQHGSWNRTTPVGAQIMHVDFDEDGNVVSSEVFAKGWLDEETGEYLGRPVDVKQYLDGSLLVSDDLVGAIYRISYDGKGQ